MCVRTAYGFSRAARSYLTGRLNGSLWVIRMSTTATNDKAQTAESPEMEADQSKTTTEQGKKEQSAAEKAWAEERNKLLADLAEVKDKYMRSLAETENVRQRMKKQVDDAKLYGVQSFCKDMLEVADILQTATVSVPIEQLDVNPHLKSLFDGLTMTESQLMKVFSKHGLNSISPAEGEKFDPNIHEALFQVPAKDKQELTIAVVQKIGYKLHDRTLRPAMVGVFKTL